MDQNWKSLLAARESEDHFVVEGRHAVERLQDSRFRVVKIIEIGKDLSRAEASELLGFHFHRSLLAVARKPENPLLSEMTGRPGTVVVLPEIADPGNLGTIIRNTAALGGSGILLGKGASPWNAKAIRASAGTLFRLPIRRSDDLVAELQELAQSRTLIGTSLSEGSQPLSELPKRWQSPALLLGPEDFGLSPEIESLCHHLVHIPMSRGIDSLNVASASAIFLHHFKDFL
jgi:TrmH family RNA methyltransferase